MPIKPKSYGVDKGIIYITQGFGENQLDYSKLKDINGNPLKGHNGIDFKTKHCDNGECWTFAPMDGYVVSDKMIQSDTKGRFVTMMSEPVLVNGKEAKAEVVSFHLKEAKVSVTDPVSYSFFFKPNRMVRKGTMIGLTDNTGSFTTGAHLHFGLRLYWKRENGYYTPDYNNGYNGFVDPMPFLKDDQIYQRGSDIVGRHFYYNGKEIDRSQVDALIPKQYR